MFGEVIVYCFQRLFRQMQRLRVIADGNSHKTEKQSAVSLADLCRDRWCAEYTVSDFRRRGSIQESRNQPAPGHSCVFHDLGQNTWLDGEDSGQRRMGNTLCLAAHAVNIDWVAAMTFQPNVDVGLAGIPSSHNVKDTAFCGDHGENAAVVGK